MAAALLRAAANWLSEGNASGLGPGVRAMTAGYTKGADSTEALTDLRSYIAVRLPATYAACEHVLAKVAGLAPDFQPCSVMDLGAGPGTASWAAAEAWPEVANYTFVDFHPGLASLAKQLCSAAESPALEQAFAVHADLTRDDLPGSADMVVAAYALAEVALTEIPALTLKAWKAAQQALVIIEPGTPAGFARIAMVRQKLLELGAHILAPCPHQSNCPIAPPDWCHFSVRLPRSRIHMQAKQAKVPFEDEKFSYLVAMRHAAGAIAARILAPTQVSKSSVALKLCEEDGIKQRLVARRRPAAYKFAKKLAWGDGLTQQDMEQLWPEN